MRETVLSRGLLLLAAASLALSVRAEPMGVTFEYAPPEWQTAICLPDDPSKSLVDHDGKLLYHYKERNREFATTVHAEVAENVKRTGQELLSPRVPIVRTMRAAESLSVVEEAFAVTDRAGTAPESPRDDVVLVSVTNAGNKPARIRPVIVVDSGFQIEQVGRNAVRTTGDEIVACTHPVSRVDVTRHNGYVARMTLKPMRMKRGETVRFAVVHRGTETSADTPPSLEDMIEARSRAEAYWREANLPYDSVTIPDPGIQALVDSSIRNIWQAREIKDGLPAFQVGPTCYRGLWIVDGAFLLEAAALVGAGDQARAGVMYALSKQSPSGAFEVLSPKYYKENGIVLWTCVRHAMLTQDKDWLRSVWPRLEKAVAFIKTLRERSKENPDWLCQGLMPPGDIDGGLWNAQKGEYTNVYWNLLGLKAAVQAAHWLGDDAQAKAWQREYDDFHATFRNRAEKDMRKDSRGNAYLPIIMGNIGEELPQRAQWAFCHGVYPGQLFEEDDPLVAGNLAMLETTEREGMVYGTGWDAEGLWNYFASFYGHAWLWQGNGQKACDALYAFANHASPLLAWREEQNPKGEPYKKVGDMPHNWASAEFIRLTVHLLALDRGNELHLLEGMPAAWAKPGMKTALQGVATPFGLLSFALQVNKTGDSAVLQLQPLPDPSCEKVVVHLGAWTGGDPAGTVELSPRESHAMTIPIKPEYGFVWKSEVPADCPLEASRSITGLCFTGRHAEYTRADTWYPSWGEDDRLYSPFTDGKVDGVESWSMGDECRIGHAVIEGGHPMDLRVIEPAIIEASPMPYGGRYPCGSLMHNGVWYIGTYGLANAEYGLNWPILGPFAGFHISMDKGRTWTVSPLSCEPGKSLFPEPVAFKDPVKFGAPHFVDFGRNMEHSPDGKAYLVGHGAVEKDLEDRQANLSWITADQVYLCRVTPSPETINDHRAYEYFGGHNAGGKPIWTADFAAIRPLLEWDNNMGCVTITYNAPLKKYLMCVTDGVTTMSKFNTYVLEADALTGPWRMVTYMKDFGVQAYFVNIPSKFISTDGRTLWMCYSANFSNLCSDTTWGPIPEGSGYQMCLQEVGLVAAGAE